LCFSYLLPPILPAKGAVHYAFKGPRAEIREKGNGKREKNAELGKRDEGRGKRESTIRFS
jgi:hypothetical protein